MKLFGTMLLVVLMNACGGEQNSLEVKTARDSAGAQCAERGKCIKDPKGLVIYNRDLITDRGVVKQDRNPTLLKRLMNLVDEPKLLVMSDNFEANFRGVSIVSEFEPCDAARKITGGNPTAGQLRALKEGRFKACISYVGDSLLKKTHSLDPIEVDTRAPDVSGTVTVDHVTPDSASLKWPSAGDNVTLDGKLTYSIYTASERAMRTIDDVRNYGTLVPGTIVGGTGYMLTGLSPNKQYYSAVVVSDEAGNSNVVGSSSFTTAAFDTTTPTITSISAISRSYKQGSNIDIDVKFSEPITLSGTSSTLTLSNNLTALFLAMPDSSTIRYRYSVQVGDNRTDIDVENVNINSDKIQDAAGNNAILSIPLAGLRATSDVNLDNIAPTVSISSNRDPGPTNSNSVTLSIHFSEPVIGFDATDITVTNATKGIVTATSSTVYTLAITPTGSAVSADVASNSAIDSASNGNLASTPWSITYDSSAPTVSIATSATSPTKVSPIPVTIIFSKVVTGFDVSDITVGNGTAGSFSDSGTTYTANITPTADGAVTVDIAANKAQDAANNGNTVAPQLSMTYDSTPPSSPSLVINSGTDYTSTTAATLTLSAGGASEIYVSDTAGCLTGGTWEAYGTSKSWILAQTNASATVYAKFRDAVGNETECVSDTIIHDDTAPLAPVIADASKSFNASFSTSIQQGVPVDTNFKEFRYTITNTDPTCSTGTASSTLPTSVTIPAGTTTLKAISCDLAGNFSPVATAVYTYDVTPPNAPTVTGTTPTSNTTPTWSWTSGGDGGNATYRYRLNNSDMSTGTTTTTSLSYTPGSALSEATHTLYLQERDAAGNWSTSGSLAIQVVTPPAAPTLSTPTRNIGSLSLMWASVSGATSYNLYWSTLTGVTTSSNKISGVVSIHTHTSLTGGATYYYKLAAVNSGIESTLSNEVSASPYSYAAPTVTAISPNSGSVSGGTSVTITGTGFVTGATVSIGGASATAVTFGSATSLTATTPARSSGAQNVVVTNPDGQTGTLTGGYTYSIPVCPTNYVKVAANATLGTSEFCVAKYEIKNSGGNIAVSEAQGLPWVDIPRDTSNGVTGAIARCQELSTASAKYDLISNAQWQALAREIETAQSSPGVYLNWSNNSTSGTNYMNRGHSDNSPGNALAASTDNAPCSGTGNTNCATSSHADFNQKRTHTLKSGEIIWDVAGNVYEWVKDNNNASQGSDSYVSTNSWSSEVRLKFGPEGNYSTKNSGEYGGLGYGRLNSSAGTVVRGGDWNNDAWTGVFAAGLHVGPTFIWYEVGFRCVLLLEP